MTEPTAADRERAADLADQIEPMGPAMTYRTLAVAIAAAREEGREEGRNEVRAKVEELADHWRATSAVPLYRAEAAVWVRDAAGIRAAVAPEDDR